jgi:hypothetical protein
MDWTCRSRCSVGAVCLGGRAPCPLSGGGGRGFSVPAGAQISVLGSRWVDPNRPALLPIRDLSTRTAHSRRQSRSHHEKRMFGVVACTSLGDPQLRAGARAVHVGGFVFVLGGDSAPKRVDVFNLERRRWEKPLFLKHEWARELSVWVEDGSKIVLGSGLSSKGKRNSKIEVIDAIDPHDLRTEHGHGYGFKDASQVQIVNLEGDKVAIGHKDFRTFLRTWSPPRVSHENLAKVPRRHSPRTMDNEDSENNRVLANGGSHHRK